MPWRILVPAAVAAAAAGLVIIATVELTVPDKTSSAPLPREDLKQTVSALSTAVTAFLGAAFIDWAADGKDSRVADWIRSVFYVKYDGYFTTNSSGEKAVFTMTEIDSGRGPAARAERAEKIAAALQTNVRHGQSSTAPEA